MDLEQVTPLFEETGISVDPTVHSDMDSAGISETVDDCLDQDQAFILSGAKFLGKGCQHRTLSCNKIRFSCG